MKKSYVYKITCKINGEYYFGSSFRAKSDYYWGTGRRIKERISKYGKENFVKEILGEFDDRVEAHKLENQYIEQFINDEKCLNITCDHKFGTYSDESREKIGAAKLGKTFSEEHRAKISDAQRGKHLSEETRAKMSAVNRGDKNPMYGKHHTEETRAKMSAAHSGKHWRKNPVTGKREWYD